MFDFNNLIASAFKSGEAYQKKEIEGCMVEIRLTPKKVDDFDCYIMYNDTSENYFYVNYEERKGMAIIEGLEVEEKMQRRGIGTILFKLMYDFIIKLNQYYKENNIDTVTKISGYLSRAEFPYDEFHKSIPFYKKQADNLNVDFRVWEKPQFSEPEKEIKPSEFNNFINGNNEGRFEFLLKQ